MGYLAIARQWRPNKFEDLVGQGHVVQTLKNAIRLNRVSHAYLFSGARGVGKTSVARIFAKALRCPNATDGVPCNACTECLAIAESRSVDVAEIDGASNNGVEAVRSIRENVAYLPSSGTYKVYIIDEVHMLSLSAFNALLKTLEEPPAHVIFLFATTEVQKIPLTIMSRCQRFEFRRLTNNQIVQRLLQILAEEKISMAEDALRLIASHADGSLRDALSLLDQVMSYFGSQAMSTEALTEKQVVEALGVSENNTLRQFLALILKQDVKGLVVLIGEAYGSGVDLKHFAERTLEELRLLYLAVLGKETGAILNADELDISASHFGALNELAKGASLLQVERMAQILSKAVGQLGWSSAPRFVLEMAAVRMTKLDALSKIEAALASATPLVMPEPAPEPVAHSLEQEPALPATRVVPQSAPHHRPFPANKEMPMRESDAHEGPPHHGGEGNTPAQWRAFVDSVMKKRPLLGALLSHANFKIENSGKSKAIVLVFPEGSFYERQASDQKNRSEIEEQLKNFFGRDTQVSLSSTVANTVKSIEQANQAEVATIKKNALEHPSVLKVKEILGAEVVDVNVEL